MRLSGAKPIDLSSSRQAMPAAPAPLQTSLVFLMSRPVRSSALSQPSGRNDRSAVLVVVEHRDVHQFAQALLDDEALRRLDVLEIDAAPAGAEIFDAVDELVGIFGGDLKIDGVDVGEALEQHRLAFHHRLCRQRAAIAKTENGGAVGDDGDEIALHRVVVGACSDRRRWPAPARRRPANRRATGRAASPSAWWQRLPAFRAGRRYEIAELPGR